MESTEKRLDTIPVDVIYGIVALLETARDVAHVAQTCRRLHQLMGEQGWRIFARTRFPSLAPASSLVAWDKISVRAPQGPEALWLFGSLALFASWSLACCSVARCSLARFC